MSWMAEVCQHSWQTWEWNPSCSAVTFKIYHRHCTTMYSDKVTEILISLFPDVILLNKHECDISLTIHFLLNPGFKLNIPCIQTNLTLSYNPKLKLTNVFVEQTVASCVFLEKFVPLRSFRLCWTGRKRRFGMTGLISSLSCLASFFSKEESNSSLVKTCSQMPLFVSPSPK